MNLQAYIWSGGSSGFRGAGLDPVLLRQKVCMFFGPSPQRLSDFNYENSFKVFARVAHISYIVLLRNAKEGNEMKMRLKKVSGIELRR